MRIFKKKLTYIENIFYYENGKIYFEIKYKVSTLLFKNDSLKRWYAKKVDVVRKLILISFDCQWIWWGRNFDKEFGNKRKKLWNWLA